MPDIDSDLQKALKQAKKKARNFAIIAKGASVLKLIVDKKPIKEGVLQKLKKECKGNAIVKGTVSGDGPELVFRVTEEPSLADVKLKKFIADETKLMVRPRFHVASDVVEIDDDSPDEPLEDADSQTPPPPDNEAARFTARLKAMKPALDQAIASKTPAGDEVKLRASELAAFAREKDFVQAQRVLDAVETLLKNMPTGAPQPGPAPGGIADEGAFRRQWGVAKEAWQRASDAVDGQIAQLQAALRKSGDDELEEIAEFGLNGVTGNFKVPLMAVMMDLEGATGEALGKAAAKARDIVANFRKHLDAEDLITACEENPFGVKVSIRGLLGGALAEMTRVLQAAGKG